MLGVLGADAEGAGGEGGPAGRGADPAELRGDSVRAAACCHTDRGELSTDHAASSCGQLVLVLDGEAYGPRPGERSGEQRVREASAGRWEAAVRRHGRCRRRFARPPLALADAGGGQTGAPVRESRGAGASLGSTHRGV